MTAEDTLKSGVLGAVSLREVGTEDLDWFFEFFRTLSRS